MNENPTWVDVEIIDTNKPNYILKLITETKDEAILLRSSIVSIKVKCITDSSPMLIFVTFKTGKIQTGELNAALAWRDCSKINLWAVGYLNDPYMLEPWLLDTFPVNP